MKTSVPQKCMPPPANHFISLFYSLTPPALLHSFFCCIRFWDSAPADTRVHNLDSTWKHWEPGSLTKTSAPQKCMLPPANHFIPLLSSLTPPMLLHSFLRQRYRYESAQSRQHSKASGAGLFYRDERATEVYTTANQPLHSIVLFVDTIKAAAFVFETALQIQEYTNPVPSPMEML